jgi:Raf kinase inhibitor-like YbhB/YbcL family protein
VTFDRPIVASCLLAVAALLAACDTDDGQQLRPPTDAQRAAMTTTTTTDAAPVPEVPGAAVGTAGPAGSGSGGGAVSSVPPASDAAAPTFTLTAPWPDGGPIEARFTCDGEDISPALSWTAPPEGTAELALMVTDDDAGGFVHWAVAGIPAAAGGIAEGETVPGAIEGVTSFGEAGWGGPCPPSGTHTYRFSLYALAQQAEVAEGFGSADLAVYTASASLTVAEVTGTYARP